MGKKRRSAGMIESSESIDNNVEVPEELLSNLEETPIEEAPMASTVVEVPVEDDVEILEKKFGKEYYEHLKKSGMDLAFKGGWQKNLVRWLNTVFNLHKKSVLDIGCAAGSMTSSFSDFGCRTIGTDISNFLIGFSRQFSSNLVNFPAWEVEKIGKKFDFIYIMETISCIPESKIEETFKAIRKVCNPGAIIFGTVKLHKELLNTPYEVLAMPNEEWVKLLEKSGFENIFPEAVEKMNKSVFVHNYYKMYEWDLIVGKAI